MVVKDVAKEVIDRLPAEASFDDIIYALYVRASFEKGEREIREGKGIDHQEAMGRLSKWLK